MLTVIKCIKIVIGFYEMNLHFDFYKKELNKLLDKINNDNNASQELIKATMELVDCLGRIHIYEYRNMFENLSKRIKHS
jgi:hypothetical protein